MQSLSSTGPRFDHFDPNKYRQDLLNQLTELSHKDPDKALSLQRRVRFCSWSRYEVSQLALSGLDVSRITPHRGLPGGMQSSIQGGIQGGMQAEMSEKTLEEELSAIESQTTAQVSELKYMEFPRIAFGKVEWEKYFGDVGVEPPLPENINEILKSQCVYWPDKRVEDTHLLVLIPKTVDGNALTLNSLGELIQRPRGGGTVSGLVKSYFEAWQRNRSRSG